MALFAHTGFAPDTMPRDKIVNGRTNALLIMSDVRPLFRTVFLFLRSCLFTRFIIGMEGYTVVSTRVCHAKRLHRGRTFR